MNPAWRKYRFTAQQLGDMVQEKKKREQANVDELMAPDGTKTLLEQAEDERDSE